MQTQLWSVPVHMVYSNVVWRPVKRRVILQVDVGLRAYGTSCGCLAVCTHVRTHTHAHTRLQQILPTQSHVTDKLLTPSPNVGGVARNLAQSTLCLSTCWTVSQPQDAHMAIAPMEKTLGSVTRGRTLGMMITTSLQSQMCVVLCTLRVNTRSNVI